jgi:putative inorganic carbon (HCO3(-)) transporter
LSAYLGILLAFGTAFALRRDERRLTYAALALASAALVLTISRSGVVASLAGAGVVLAVSKGTQRRGAMLAIAAGGLAGGAVIALWGFAAKHAVAGVAILGRFGSTAETADAGNVGTRAQLWHAAILLWRTHPLLGIGAGNFELDLGRAGYPLLHTHANSLFLQSLAEGGIPLLLATLALVIVSIAAFARGPFSDPLVAGAFGASIGLAAHQLVDLLVFYPKVGEMWWIALALAAVRVAGPGRHAVPP